MGSAGGPKLIEHATCATEAAGSATTTNARTSEPNNMARISREAIQTLFLVGLRLPGVAVNLRVARSRGYLDPESSAANALSLTSPIAASFLCPSFARDVALFCMHLAHLKKCP